MPDETWDGDDEADELPVLGPDAHQSAPEPPRSRRRRKGHAFPRQGIPTALRAEAQRQALAEATGKGISEPDQWREDLALGDHGRASSSIQRGRDHGSSSGFGLA